MILPVPVPDDHAAVLEDGHGEAQPEFMISGDDPTWRRIIYGATEYHAQERSRG